jgi:hypothetical protein
MVVSIVLSTIKQRLHAMKINLHVANILLRSDDGIGKSKSKCFFL